MRLLTVLLLITVSTKADKKRRGDALRKIYKKDMDFPRRVDVNSDTFSRPVPFGHIFKDGFEDPTGELKQPIDLLELDTVYLRDTKRAREIIETFDKDFQRIQKHRSYLSPKDQAYDTQLPVAKPRSTNASKMYWNIASIQQKNMYDPPKRRIDVQKENVAKPLAVMPSEYKSKHVYFKTGSFGLESDKMDIKFNFTTCNEFGRNAKFHPNDIVDVEWVPFYIWTYELMGRVTIAKVHRFMHPTKKLVRKYREEFNNHLNKSIDWEQPKLLLREENMEMLLIAADRKGLFNAIPYNELPDSVKKSAIKIPVTSLRLKIVDPYLAMMFCGRQYATIMATAGMEPKTVKEKAAEASTLKMEGPGFPVKRDLDTERMIGRARSEHQMRSEMSKFIDLEDQMNAARTKLL